MPAEASSIRTSVLLGITLVELVVGTVAVFNSVYLIDSFGDTIRNATVYAKNLPVDEEILVNGVMPAAIIVPQAIILPTILGIIASAARNRCGYIAHLVFAFSATLWSPIQTTAILFYVFCYGFLYAQHLDDRDGRLREELMKVFFCFIGLFLISLIFCFLSFASSVASCCILCNCCQPRRPARPPRWILHTGGGGSDTAALLQLAADDDQPGQAPPLYSSAVQLVPGIVAAPEGQQPASIRVAPASVTDGGHTAAATAAAFGNAAAAAHDVVPPEQQQEALLIVLD